MDNIIKKGFGCLICLGNGGCREQSYVGRYNHWSLTFKKQMFAKQRCYAAANKPENCEFCCKETSELTFSDEPFCYDILGRCIPLWICDECYTSSNNDIEADDIINPKVVTIHGFIDETETEEI